MEIDYFFFFKGDLIAASHYGWTSEQRSERLSPMDQRISTSCKTSNLNIVIQFQFYLQIKALIQISFLLPTESYAMMARNCRTTYDNICCRTTQSGEHIRIYKRKFKILLNLLHVVLFYTELLMSCSVSSFSICLIMSSSYFFTVCS